MAYLDPHFDYDVFVSYSHGNPEVDDHAPLRDWSIRLVDKLKAHIRALEGSEFKALHIWQDPNIDPTRDLSDGLRLKVSSSAILMIIMSKNYLDSSWCKRELKWFKQQVQDRSGDDGRVFLVEAQRTDRTNWPVFLRGLPGFKFYKDTSPSEPIGFFGAGEDSPNYGRALSSLRTSLVRRLPELKDRHNRIGLRSRTSLGDGPPRIPTPDGRSARKPAPNRASVAEPRPPSLADLYLHARPQHASIYGEVKRALEQEGIRPVGLVADPGSDIADWQKESLARKKAAERCHALALVRADGDPSFIDDVYDIAVTERDTIQSSRGKPLPCAVLDRSGESLHFDVSSYGIKRFDLAKDDWRSQFHDWLNQAREEPAAAL